LLVNEFVEPFDLGRLNASSSKLKPPACDLATINGRSGKGKQGTGGKNDMAVFVHILDKAADEVVDLIALVHQVIIIQDD